MPGCRSTKGLCQTLEIPAADKQKGLLPRWLVTLQKTILFLRWIGVFYWQGPFNGCLMIKLELNQFCYGLGSLTEGVSYESH